MAVFSTGLLGQYYDVQGMTWTAAPMFANPDQTVTVGRRTYSLFYSGQHLMVVAWFEHGAVYWVHNSLTDAIGNGELLAIAEQTEPIGIPGTPGSPIGTNGARAAASRRRPQATGNARTRRPFQTIGSIGGLLTLARRAVALHRAAAPTARAVGDSRRALHDSDARIPAPGIGRAAPARQEIAGRERVGGGHRRQQQLIADCPDQRRADGD